MELHWLLMGIQQLHLYFKKRMTSSLEINTHLRDDPHFIGCFPSNKLPEVDRHLPRSMIINTHPAKGKGEHWIAIVMTKKTCFYFDSFGCPVIEFNIQKYLFKYYDKVVYSDVCVQHIMSVKCGEFCIGFVKHVCNRKSYKAYLSNFDFENVMINDLKIVSLIN